MTVLILGLVVFVGIHLVPSMAGVKSSLKGRFGDNGYRGVFSLVALAGLVLTIYGYATSGWVTVYDPPTWGRTVTFQLVLVAFILFAAANMRGRIRKALKHPMLIGLCLWCIGHLLANGDLASVLLFGAFLAYALVDMVLASSQGRIAVFEVKPIHDVMALVGGFAVYVGFMFLHEHVIGVPVVG